jgi:hypothetical protein
MGIKVPMKIKAISGNHALLRNGKVPTIGYTCDKLRYTGSGCAVPTEVCFVLKCGDRKYKDFFYFENNTLVYQVVTIKTEEDQYLAEVYSECALEKKITPKEFIFKVKDAYVNHEMGFTS